MATLTWAPSYSSRVESAPRLKVSRFGDGYVHRSIDGINAVADKWTLDFNNIDTATKDAIDLFLRQNLGATIDWTPPGEGAVRKWAVLAPWSKNPVAYNVWKLSLTLEEVFE